MIIFRGRRLERALSPSLWVSMKPVLCSLCHSPLWSPPLSSSLGFFSFVSSFNLSPELHTYISNSLQLLWSSVSFPYTSQSFILQKPLHMLFPLLGILSLSCHLHPITSQVMFITDIPAQCHVLEQVVLESLSPAADCIFKSWPHIT